MSDPREKPDKNYPYCKFCKFWHRNKEQCRRESPGMDWYGPKPNAGRWPRTPPFAWCGDFKKRKPERGSK